MKRIATLLSLAVIAVTSFTHPALADESVTVYTHRHYPTDQALFDAFTKKTGIKVNAVKSKAAGLIKRLEAEAANTPADVLITADVAHLHKAKSLGLLQPTKSDALNQRVPENLRDSEGYWFGLTKRARVIVYNKKTVNAEDLSSIEALTDAKWKGKVLVRSSSNAYNQSLVASLVTHLGEAKAQSICEGIVKNFARSPKGNDRDQMRAVISGAGDLAIVNTYYLGKLLTGNEKDQAIGKQLAIFWPNQADRGAHINVSGAGMTAHAKNKANAVKFLEFLLSDEAQKAFAEGNFEYPVKPGIAASDLVKSWGEFKADAIKLEDLGKQNSTAIKVMDRAGWK